MALGNADIAAIRAGIPAQFQPDANARGDLSMTFSAQGAGAAPSIPGDGLQFGNADPDALSRHNLGLIFVEQDTDAAAPGFMLTGAQASRRAAEAEKIAQRKRAEDSQRLMADRLREMLDARLAELDAELAKIAKRLDEIRERRIEIGDELESLDELERLAKSGKLDPANPAHAALLRRARIKPDEAENGDWFAVIARRRGELSREDEALDDEWNTQMKRHEEVEKEREKVADVRNDLENADTPEEIEKLEQRAQSVLGSQQLGEAASQTENRQAKDVAADAVAKTDEQAFDGDNSAHNEAAATNTDAFYSGKDDLDWGALPPRV